MGNKRAFYLTATFAERLRLYYKTAHPNPEPQSTPSISENWVERLRSISNELDSLPQTSETMILFPGWDSVEEVDGEQGRLVRKAAEAINNNCGPYDGIRVSPKAVAALLHYVADMCEE